jgi:hypothetical protein
VKKNGGCAAADYLISIVFINVSTENKRHISNKKMLDWRANPASLLLRPPI